MLLNNEECSVPLVDPKSDVLENKLDIGTSPLMPLFCQEYSDERKVMEATKEAQWKSHFFDYGRGDLFTIQILNLDQLLQYLFKNI